MLFRNNFMKNYNEAMFTGESSSKPTTEMWAELAENDEDFKKEFNKVFNNPDVKEADGRFVFSGKTAAPLGTN